MNKVIDTYIISLKVCINFHNCKSIKLKAKRVPPSIILKNGNLKSLKSSTLYILMKSITENLRRNLKKASLRLKIICQ